MTTRVFDVVSECGKKRDRLRFDISVVEANAEINASQEILLQLLRKNAGFAYLENDLKRLGYAIKVNCNSDGQVKVVEVEKSVHFLIDDVRYRFMFEGNRK